MDISIARTIDGWMSEKELEWLAIQAKNCHRILEIGSYKGRSTRALADNTDGKVFALDPWESVYYNDDGSLSGINPQVFPEFYQNLKDHIIDGKVIPIKQHSKDFVPAFRYDLIFIDGDHRYDSVKTDIFLAYRCINLHGIISGHDYNHSDWPGVRKVVNELFSNANIVDSIWWVKL
jgi:predicted O-methyltransferase YrrM